MSLGFCCKSSVGTCFAPSLTGSPEADALDCAAHLRVGHRSAYFHVFRADCGGLRLRGERDRSYGAGRLRDLRAKVGGIDDARRRGEEFAREAEDALDTLPDTPARAALADYDGWCAAAGLTLTERFATWDRVPYSGGRYAVSIHRIIGRSSPSTSP